MAKKKTTGERALHARVCDLLRGGGLPARKPDRIWGGPGAGAECTVCGLPVTDDEIEMELEFLDSDGRGTSRHHLHLQCYAAFEAESRNAAATGAEPDGMPPHSSGGGGPGGSALTLHDKA